MYSARDLAVLRAKKLGCGLILGSATPSYESLLNAENGKYNEVQLISGFFPTNRQRKGLSI